MGSMTDRPRMFYENAHKDRDTMEADIRKLEDLISSVMQALRSCHTGHENRYMLINEAMSYLSQLKERQAIVDFLKRC